VVYVYRSRILSKEREPQVIRGCHGAPEGMLIDIPDLKIVEEAAPPSLF
jgi:hypothetical protein